MRSLVLDYVDGGSGVMVQDGRGGGAASGTKIY